MDLGNLATLGAIAENKQTRGLRRAYFLKTSLEFQPRFFILPLVFPEKTRLHPRNSTILGYNPSEILRPKTKTPLEIPHDFLINPGNSALFLINPCENPLLFIQSVPTPENSISLTALSPPVCFFSRTARKNNLPNSEQRTKLQIGQAKIQCLNFRL